MSDSVEKIAAVLDGWAAEGMPVTTTTARSLAARLRTLSAPEASGPTPAGGAYDGLCPCCGEIECSEYR